MFVAILAISRNESFNILHVSYVLYTTSLVVRGVLNLREYVQYPEELDIDASFFILLDLVSYSEPCLLVCLSVCLSI